MRRVLLFVAITACAPRSDYTPRIEVDPRAAQRASDILSHIRARPDGGASRARVHPLLAGQALGGPNATGRPGDWVIENDEVVFVVDGLAGGGGFAASGGNLIDAADASARKDELGQVTTYLGEFPRQGVYTSLDARVEADGVAVVEARGTELREPKLRVLTEYRLARSDRALLMRTTLTNTGEVAIALAGIGDAIQWSGPEKVAPGKPVGFRGASKGPYIGAVGRFVSYAITSTDGEIASKSGGSWTDTNQAEAGVTIGAGKSTTYERVFVVGARPDLSSVVAELTRAAGGALGTLEIALTDAAGKRRAAPAGAKVVLAPGATGADALSVVAADGGVFGAELPVGTWRARLVPAGGVRGIGPAQTFDVGKYPIAQVTLAAVDLAQVAFGPCVEGSVVVPCKLTFESVGGRDPDFGPAHVTGPARNRLLLAREGMNVPLADGRYRVTASRGPEYDIAALDLVVPERPRTEHLFTLKRVVATPGYVAADFHQHSIMSFDAPVATRDRVIANAAEGVEVAVASEHNVTVDLGPVVHELGLEAFTVSIPGDELTSDIGRRAWGHANVYPLPFDPSVARGGAPSVVDREPSSLFAELRARAGGPRVVQINHPRSGPPTGYFDIYGFDRATGRGSVPGYDDSFDAVEVWNGRSVVQRTTMIEDYLALLRAGKKVTPIADTDTHGIVGEEPGYPRTLVRVGNDDVGSWDAARTDALVHAVRETRDVVLTNGPFLSVEARGSGGAVGIGGTAHGAFVDVRVVVAAPPWMKVERAELRLAGDGKVDASPVTLTDGVAHFKVRRASKADAFVVIASGTAPMRPVLDGDAAETAPWAMSGPVFLAE